MFFLFFGEFFMGVCLGNWEMEMEDIGYMVYGIWYRMRSFFEF